MPAFHFHDFIIESELEFGVNSRRLDKVLGAQEGCSRSLARRLIDAGAVFVNGRRVLRQSSPVHVGDRIRAPDQLPPLKAVDLGAPLHRDRNILALNKPVGVPAAPTPLGIRGTLPELARVQLELRQRPIVVHRLDVDVSGVMVLALDRVGAKRVTSWFTEKRARKWYRALVSGAPPESQGRIEAAIGKDPGCSGRMRADPTGDSARTDYRVLEDVDAPAGCTAVELRLHTGRTHQLRVHLAWLGCPVLGDRWYGGPQVVPAPDSRPVPRLCLHSHRLEVAGGTRKGADLVIEAPVPDFFAG